MSDCTILLKDPAITKLDRLPDGWKRTVGAPDRP